MSKSTVGEKVAYLQGLLDGQDMQDSAQKKLFEAIIGALSAVAEALEDHEEMIADLDESVVDIYEELDELDLDLLDDDDFLEIECPHCGETVYFDHDMLDDDDNLICPACNEAIDVLDELGEDEKDD